MNESDITELNRKNNTEWAELTKILDAHPNESLHDPASSEWTSKDVYAHLARWLNYSTSNIEAVLNGRELSPLEGTVSVVNARWEQEDSLLSLEEARRWAESAFDAWWVVVKSIPLERWDKQFEDFVRMDGANHFREHRGYIILGNL